MVLGLRLDVLTISNQESAVAHFISEGMRRRRPESPLFLFGLSRVLRLVFIFSGLVFSGFVLITFLSSFFFVFFVLLLTLLFLFLLLAFIVFFFLLLFLDFVCPHDVLDLLLLFFIFLLSFLILRLQSRPILSQAQDFLLDLLGSDVFFAVL